MHDPYSVAHEIHIGSRKKKNGQYRTPFITIWHVDPEIKGDDDSCGWFIRSSHIDQTILEKVSKEFAFEYKYWFNEAGYPRFSTIGLTIEMYTKAAWIIFMLQNNGNADRKRHRQFMKKNLYDIIHFAENPTDSLHPSITMKFGVQKPEERINIFSRIITTDIYRRQRKWWQHPRWHIHHWKIQFHPWQQFKRRYIDKCSICHKRGFNGTVYSNWTGSKIWCEKCGINP